MNHNDLDAMAERKNESFSDKLKLYTIRNKNDLSVSLMNYGAIMHSLVVPDKYVPLFIYCIWQVTLMEINYSLYFVSHWSFLQETIAIKSNVQSF